MKRPQSRKEIRKTIASLETELARLRTMLRESGETFIANLEAEIVQLGSSVAELEDGLESDRGIRRMVSEIRDLRVKPGKGRRRDLKRIDDLVDRLETILGDLG